MTSFHLNYLLKSPFSKNNLLKVGASTCEFWKDTIQSITAWKRSTSHLNHMVEKSLVLE